MNKDKQPKEAENNGLYTLLPKCKNYVNGQCTECELNHHKECNG
jgi:hypothetical protein